MTFKVFITFLIIIGRLLIGVKVFSWLILRLISEIPHPISEIEFYLVFMAIDIWLSGGITEIHIEKNKD